MNRNAALTNPGKTLYPAILMAMMKGDREPVNLLVVSVILRRSGSVHGTTSVMNMTLNVYIVIVTRKTLLATKGTSLRGYLASPAQTATISTPI